MEKATGAASARVNKKEDKKSPSKTKLERMKEFNNQNKAKMSPSKNNERKSSHNSDKMRGKSPGNNKATLVHNPIPKNQKDRIFYVKNIFSNESLQRHLNGSPARASSTYEDVAKYLSGHSKNEMEIFALIFLWITNNISYDATSFFSGAFPDQNPENIFKLGLSVCDGYAGLFNSMCQAAGVKSEKVVGFAKGFTYKEGDSCAKNNHAWNVIQCFNSWYIVDSTWGAGSVNSERKFVRKLNPFYFLPLPELLIGTHRPTNDKWQLMNRAMGLKHFEGKKAAEYSYFFNSAYDNNIDLLTHPLPIITLNEKKAHIKFGNKNLMLTAQLKNANENITEVNGSVSTSFDSMNNIFLMDLEINKNGEYVLWVSKVIDGVQTAIIYYTLNVNILISNKRTARDPKNKNSMDQFPIVHYRGKTAGATKKPVKNSDVTVNCSSLENLKSDSLISPLKPKCFDNSNAYLYEPKNYNNIKIGQAVKFKVKVKGANSVAVLDYKQFHYLKRKGDDIWEGIVNVKTEFITIVSQKSSSLYTEVFEFSNIK